MKTVILFTVSAYMGSAPLWAADELKPMDVKTGLWETTLTTQMSGMPPIPAEALARLTPEQRARMEAMMKQRGTQGPQTSTTKSCVTKEDLEKMRTSFAERENCKSTVLHSSSREQDIRVDCGEKGIQASMAVHIQAIDSENVKGTTQATATGGGNDSKMNTQVSFTSKWLGSDCGDLKKQQEK